MISFLSNLHESVLSGTFFVAIFLLLIVINNKQSHSLDGLCFCGYLNHGGIMALMSTTTFKVSKVMGCMQVGMLSIIACQWQYISLISNHFDFVAKPDVC